LEIYELILGPTHPDTATSYNNIGTALSKKDECDNALEYFQKALVIFESVLGADHPDTKNCQLWTRNAE